LAATDDTSRRPGQRGGRPDVRRRVRRQCGRAARVVGSLIPHAGPIRALVIAMIQPALGTGPVPVTCRTNGRVAGGAATRLGAVRMAAITRRTDGKQAVAPPTRLLTEGAIHGVGARGSDWTTARKRGTTGMTGTDVGARVGHGGPVVKTGPPPLPVSSAYCTPARGRCPPRGRADAPTGRWKTAARFPTPPTGIIVFL
jgi:hypothetical protein